MKYVKGQFVCLVQMPNFNSTLKYTDTLTYVAIRSFNNESDGCFPAYETIAARAGCCRSFVIASIKRLELAGFITVERSKKLKEVNRYTFEDSYMFEQIPYEFFDQDLSIYEKSMLLCLRPHFRHGILTSIESNRELATRLGVSYKVVHKNVTALINKGYITKVACKYRKYKRKFTDKIDWQIDYDNQFKLPINYPTLKVG